MVQIYVLTMMVLAGTASTITAQEPNHVPSGVPAGQIENRGSQPNFPPSAHSGCVSLDVQVDETGTVKQAHAVAGSAELREPVERAALDWQFRPMMRDGVAIPIQSTVWTCYDFGRVGGPGQGVEPMRLSSAVAAAHLVAKVLPVFPPAVSDAHVSGAVVARVIVDTEGNVADVHIISGPEALREGVVASIRQWRYRPYMLNGKATPIDTVVVSQVSFGS